MKKYTLLDTSIVFTGLVSQIILVKIFSLCIIIIIISLQYGYCQFQNDRQNE